MPAGSVTIAESPHRGHHQLVTPGRKTHPHQSLICVSSRVDGPGPDGERAEVGAAGVHDGLVHVVPG